MVVMMGVSGCIHVSLPAVGEVLAGVSGEAHA
jgi:hypothetical protein